MRKLIIPTAIAAVVLSGCSPVPQIRACATVSEPPVVLADAECNTGKGKWYSAPANDIEADDMPVVGEPLDGDFWDWRDRADLKKTTPKKTTAKKKP